MRNNPKIAKPNGKIGTGIDRRQVSNSLMLDPEEQAMLEWASSMQGPVLSGTTSQNLIFFGGGGHSNAANHVNMRNVDNSKSDKNETQTTKMTEPPTPVNSSSDFEAGKNKDYNSTDVAMGGYTDNNTKTHSDLIVPTGAPSSKLDNDYTRRASFGQPKLKSMPSLAPLPRVTRLETV